MHRRSTGCTVQALSAAARVAQAATINQISTACSNGGKEGSVTGEGLLRQPLGAAGRGNARQAGLQMQVMLSMCGVEKLRTMRRLLQGSTPGVVWTLLGKQACHDGSHTHAHMTRRMSTADPRNPTLSSCCQKSPATSIDLHAGCVLCQLVGEPRRGQVRSTHRMWQATHSMGNSNKTPHAPTASLYTTQPQLNLAAQGWNDLANTVLQQQQQHYEMKAHIKHSSRDQDNSDESRQHRSTDTPAHGHPCSPTSPDHSELHPRPQPKAAAVKQSRLRTQHSHHNPKRASQDTAVGMCVCVSICVRAHLRVSLTSPAAAGRRPSQPASQRQALTDRLPSRTANPEGGATDRRALYRRSLRVTDRLSSRQQTQWVEEQQTPDRRSTGARCGWPSADRGRSAHAAHPGSPAGCPC